MALMSLNRSPSISHQANRELVWDLRFDEFSEKDERFLPAEIACFGRDDVRHTFLQNVHFRSTGYLREYGTASYLVVERDPVNRHAQKPVAARSGPVLLRALTARGIHDHCRAEKTDHRTERVITIRTRSFEPPSPEQ